MTRGLYKRINETLFIHKKVSRTPYRPNKTSTPKVENLSDFVLLESERTEADSIARITKHLAKEFNRQWLLREARQLNRLKAKESARVRKELS